MQVAYAAAMKAKTTHIAMKMSGKARLTAKGDVRYGGRQPYDVHVHDDARSWARARS